jgi:hypothetical protein
MASRALIRWRTARGIRLDRGNATPASLGEDFGLLGMSLWEDLRGLYPARARVWHERLALLNELRNGLAHADDQRVVTVSAAGWPLTLRSIRRWRSTLDRLAIGMDRAVREHLREKLGVVPW